MIEILWNGRGGQGAFTADGILGAAWALKTNEASRWLSLLSGRNDGRTRPGVYQT